MSDAEIDRMLGAVRRRFKDAKRRVVCKRGHLLTGPFVVVSMIASKENKP